jgi:hypothetical protein
MLIRLGCALLCCAILGFVASDRAAADESAEAIVRSSATAMGGEALLRSIRTVEFYGVGERQMVEQSERPTGPYLLDHFALHEIEDLDGRRLWTDQQDQGYASNGWWLQKTTPDDTTTIVNGSIVALVGSNGKQQYAGSSGISLIQEQLALGPERLLLTALSARDLRSLPDVTLHGMLHRVVAFTWNGVPCRLFINASTMLPWKLSYTRAYDDYIFYSPWGDVTTDVVFTEWSLERNGLHYPREWTYRRLGLPDQQISITSLRFNVPLDPAKMTVDPSIVASAPAPRRISRLRFGGKSLRAVTLGPDFVQVPSSWNVEFVNQPDGVIVIEAPIGSNYAKQAFAFARSHFHKRIKGVITTSDSFPHIAGVRQAVAEGIPIYALDLNLPILRRLIAAPHHLLPDDLARAPRPAQIIAITGKTIVGSGVSSIEILPYRTATAERQMMVYMPAARLLYTSDLFSPDGNGGWFTPQYLSEFISTCHRYGISPNVIFGMHYPATKYDDVANWLNRFER